MPSKKARGGAKVYLPPIFLLSFATVELTHFFCTCLCVGFTVHLLVGGNTHKPPPPSSVLFLSVVGAISLAARDERD